MARLVASHITGSVLIDAYLRVGIATLELLENLVLVLFILRCGQAGASV
jgi:hypothetical protein